MDANLSGRLAAFVRAADPDRYFATLFAPPERRALLYALYAFNVELARVAENVHEPMLAAIRLEWWRETVEGASRGAPRNHDVAKALAVVLGETGVALEDLQGLIAARAFDCSPEPFADFAELQTYVAATSGRLMGVAAQISGAKPEPTREAALAYGLAGLLRSIPLHSRRHKLYLPLDVLSAHHVTPDEFFHLQKQDRRRIAIQRQVADKARAHFLAARRGPRPGPALAAVLPAALVPVYLRKLDAPVPIHRRLLVLLGAAMRRRL